MTNQKDKIVSYALMPKPRSSNKPHFVDDEEDARRSAEQFRTIGHMAWGAPPPPPPPPAPGRPWSARLKLAVMIVCGSAVWVAVAVAAYFLTRAVR